MPSSRDGAAAVNASDLDMIDVLLGVEIQNLFWCKLATNFEIGTNSDILFTFHKKQKRPISPSSCYFLSLPGIMSLFISEVLTGLTLSLTSIPQLLTYAETLGLAPTLGLQTAGPPLLSFGLLSSDPKLAAGLTAVTAAMTRAALTSSDAKSEHSYEQQVAAFAVAAGYASLVLCLFNVGSILSKAPKSVTKGFKWGCSVGILLGSVPNGVFEAGSRTVKAFAGSSTEYKAASGAIAAIVDEYRIPSPAGLLSILKSVYALITPRLYCIPALQIFALSCLTLTYFNPVVYGLTKFKPPSGVNAVVVMAAATLYCSVTPDYPGGVVGTVPAAASGGSNPMIPLLNTPAPFSYDPALLYKFHEVLLPLFSGSWPQLIMSVFTFASVNYLAIIAILSSLPATPGDPHTPNLLAQGVSSLVSGVTGGAPPGGSLSRTMVATMLNVQTRVAVITTSLAYILLLDYITPLVETTPKSALAAVIFVAVYKTVLLPVDLFSLKGTSFVTGWITALSTAFFNPAIGFCVGVTTHVAMIPFSKQKKD